MHTDFGHRKRNFLRPKQQTSCNIFPHHQMQTLNFDYNKLQVKSRIRYKIKNIDLRLERSKSKQLAQNKHYQQQKMIQQGRTNTKSEQNSQLNQACSYAKTPRTAYNHRRVFRSNDRSTNNMLHRQSKTVSKDDNFEGKYRQLSVNGINLLIIKFLSLPKEKSRDVGSDLFERLKQATIHLKPNYSYLQNIFINYNLGVCYLNYESTGFSSNRIFYHFNLTLQGIHEECNKNVKNNIKELVLFSGRTPKFVDMLQRNSFLHSLQASILLQLGSFCSSKIRDNGEGYKYSQKSFWKSLISLYEQQALYLCWFLRFMVMNNFKVKTGRQNIPYSQILSKLQSRRGEQIQFRYQQMKIVADYLYILMVDIEILIKSVNALVNSPKILSFLSYFTKNNFRIHKRLIQSQNFVKELWASILNYTLYDVPNLRKDQSLQLIKTFIHNQSKDFVGQRKNYKFLDHLKIKLRPYQQFSFPKANKAQNRNKICLKNIHIIFLQTISSLYAMSVQSKLASKLKIQNESLQKVGIELSTSLLKICFKYCENYYKHTSFYYQVKVQHDCLVLPHEEIKQNSIQEDEKDSEQPGFEGQYQMIELSDEENLESQALYEEMLVSKNIEGRVRNDEFQDSNRNSNRRQSRYKPEQDLQKRSKYEQRVIKSLNISLQKLEEEQLSTRRDEKIRSLEKKVLKDPAVKKIIAVYNQSHKRLTKQKKEINKKDNQKQSAKRVNMFMIGPSYFSRRKFHFNQAIHQISQGTKKYNPRENEHLEHSSNINNTQFINFKNIRLNQKQVRFNKLKNFEKL